MTTPGLDDGAGQNMGDLLDEVEPMRPYRRGDVVEGVIMRADPDGIFINIGHKAEGIVPPGEMRSLAPEALEQLKVGDEIVTLVVQTETGERGAVLSIDKAEGEMGWRVLEKAMEAGESLEGTIVGFNRGGAIVECEGVNGFVPMSQLVSVARVDFREPPPAPSPPPVESPPAAESAPTAEIPPAAGTQATEESPSEEGGDKSAEAVEGEAQALEVQQPEAEPPRDPREDDIGKVLQFKVLEVNRPRNRAIFSERQAIQEWRDEQKARLIQELTEGETRSGRVTGISSFGAFVDLGGADGLIHISELSWSPVNTPEDVVKVGDELDVYVLRVDAENKKIALSLRRLQAEPWETITKRFQVGDIVDATVTKLTNFGAFARVEGDEGAVEGLIHISELSDRMVGHPREVVQEGDAVKLRILRIEPERRRLGLSLKQAKEELDD
jgi:ribosomal protein S1